MGWVLVRVLLATMLLTVGLTTASCSSADSECYTTGEPGSAQEQRDIDRAAKWGCDHVDYEGVN